MDAAPSLLLTGIAAFAATNVDDLLLLAVFFAERTRARLPIVAGQYAGIAILFGLSAAAALAAVALPTTLLAWLGVVPIALGVRALWSHDEDASPAPRWSFAGVAATTVANGGDNLGVYIPLFAAAPPGALIVWGATFAVFTGVWCALAAALVERPAARRAIDRFGHRFVPWALIAIGVWILLR